MNSNRIYMHKALSVLAIVSVLFGIYVLVKGQSLKGSTLTDHNENKQNDRMVKLDPPCSSLSGTVLDVTGQLVAVQGVDSPCTIRLVYVNGDLPTGLVPGKKVIMQGEFKNGLINTGNITIIEGSPWTLPATPPHPLGLIEHMIFFIAYWLL